MDRCGATRGGTALGDRNTVLHRIQLRHFLVFNVLPFVGTIVALGLAFIHPIQRRDVFLFFGMWLLTGLEGFCRISSVVHSPVIQDYNPGPRGARYRRQHGRFGPADSGAAMHRPASPMRRP